MAARTSQQSGNFSASTTWGALPADGDTFTIVAGHSVTSSTVDMPTNGYGDITVHGCWSMQSGSQFKLNGRATIRGGEDNYFTEGESNSAGKFEMKPNTELVLNGTNSEQHGVWCETEKRTQVICDGGEKNLTDVISCSAYLDYQQDFLPVATASNFAAGDWISVFSRFEGYQVMSDENFFVHDVDTTANNHKIYYRQFVSPTAVIQRFKSPRVIQVDNAKVFRVGYKIIFGTGSDRNVVTITGIDFLRNFIAINANVSGTISNLIGKTIYQTGNEKKHFNGFGTNLLVQSGSQVRRNATTLTTAIETADSTADIVVGNASDLVVGDEIIIDVNNDTDTNYDYNSKYTINAIDGTTLTLDDQVRHVHKVGCLVLVLNRDCIISGEAGSDRPFVYIEEWTSQSGNGYTRRIRFRNVQFKGLGGNTNNNYYRSGICIAGYNGGLDPTSSDTDNYGFQTELDGCTYDPTAIVDNGYSMGSSYLGIYIRRCDYMTTRNNVCYNSERGFFNHSSHYNHGFFGNYSTRASYSTGHHESQYDEYGSFSYNYFTRSDDYGMLFYYWRAGGYANRHNYFLNHEQRPFYNYYAVPNIIYDRWYIDGFRSMPLFGESSGPHIFHDSYIKNRWTVLAPDGTGQVYTNYINGAQSYQTDWQRNLGKGGEIVFQEYNFEIDGLAIHANNLFREYLNDEGCWLCYNENDAHAGYVDMIYVPPKTTVRISCEIKCQGDGSFTFPYLFARTAHDATLTGRRDDGASDEVNMTSTTAQDIGRSKGFLESVQYTSDSQANFEEKQLTVQPQKDGYYLNLGIYNTSTNIREEPFRMKEPVVRFDKAGRGESRVDGKTNTNPKVRSNFTTIKKRISGRI